MNLFKKTPVQLTRTGEAFNQWLDVEMNPLRAKERKEQQTKMDDWEQSGKPITLQEIKLLMGGIIGIDEMREIQSGNSPLLDGFRLINEDGSPFVPDGRKIK